jgi:hypothetical protein
VSLGRGLLGFGSSLTHAFNACARSFFRPPARPLGFRPIWHYSYGSTYVSISNKFISTSIVDSVAQDRLLAQPLLVLLCASTFLPCTFAQKGRSHLIVNRHSSAVHRFFHTYVTSLLLAPLVLIFTIACYSVCTFFQ